MIAKQNFTNFFFLCFFIVFSLDGYTIYISLIFHTPQPPLYVHTYVFSKKEGKGSEMIFLTDSCYILHFTYTDNTFAPFFLLNLGRGGFFFKILKNK